MPSEIPKEKNNLEITVVIPAYKVKAHILGVIASIGPEVQRIIVIDDACPEESGLYVQTNVFDPRIRVLTHERNLGVGGAVKSGYREAVKLGADIIIKIDGDGQMDPKKISDLIKPILQEGAEYTKGNRFFEIESVLRMPKVRILGNLCLSFLTKLSTGYWQLFDPNNGYTAINAKTLQLLPLDKIDNRYFFESDMLFRLNLVRAKVNDVSIPAIYNDEKSNLKIRKVLIEFPWKHLRNFMKRVTYSYYLRDFTLASIELPLGIALINFGLIIGTYNWIVGLQSSTATPTGTAILVAMATVAGLQLVLAFFSYDISNVPTRYIVKEGAKKREIM